MTDREKVINALEHCSNGCDIECPYEYPGALTLEYCQNDLMRDALELLKNTPNIIHCNECKHADYMYGYDYHCKIHNEWYNKDFYCANGEGYEIK